MLIIHSLLGHHLSELLLSPELFQAQLLDDCILMFQAFFLRLFLLLQHLPQKGYLVLRSIADGGTDGLSHRLYFFDLSEGKGTSLSCLRSCYAEKALY